MKTERQWLIVSMVSIFLAATPVQATGPPDQGTLMAGQGLDWERSATELQPLAIMTAKAFPPKGEKFSTVAADFVVSATKCTTITNAVEACAVTATLHKKEPEVQLCGHWLTATPTVLQMFVFQGKPDPGGAFTFGGGSGPTKDVFFACSVSDPANPDRWEWRMLGAAGKCLLWPQPGGAKKFAPSIQDAREFNACVRALRADYCGNGVTHTVDGTEIDLYRVSPGSPAHSIVSPFLLEAWWNEKGALCVIHARWAAMSPACKRQFNIILGVKGDDGDSDGTGTDYHCDPNRVESTELQNCPVTRALLQRVMRKALLADDSMLH